MHTIKVVLQEHTKIISSSNFPVSVFLSKFAKFAKKNAAWQSAPLLHFVILKFIWKMRRFFSPIQSFRKPGLSINNEKSYLFFLDLASHHSDRNLCLFLFDFPIKTNTNTHLLKVYFLTARSPRALNQLEK